MADQTHQWNVGEFIIHCDGGDVRVAGWKCGVWALDFRTYEIFDEVSPGWALTHLPSGHIAAAIIESLENAQAIVGKIDALGDWSFTDAKMAGEFATGMRDLVSAHPDVLLLKHPLFGPGFYIERPEVQAA